ncbi:MAG: glycoside hydrolase family 3 N-terminal domain-containing protein [Ilumatobacteraceae bacterium]
MATGTVAPDGTLVTTSEPTEAPATAAPVTAAPITAASTTTPDPYGACLAQWPLRDRIALLVWPAVYSSQWQSAERVVRDQRVGGVILMRPSDAFAADLGANLAALTALSAHGLAVATDEEGGAVQRLAALGSIPSQQELSSLGPDAAGAIIAAHAVVLADAGIDVILGPVVDVRPEVGDDPLGQGRLFEGTPQEVAALGAAYVNAWQSAGLTPILKHYPGHGSASADTHQLLATTPELSLLAARDLVPYQLLAGSGAGVMVGHLNVPGLTNGQPASLSPEAVAYLRADLGWGDALVMTDALGMGAVGLPVPEAAVRSLQAGVDVVIFTSTDDAAPVIDAIVGAVAAGALTEAEIDDSARRVLRILEKDGSTCAG